jgi:hypothetical protein
MNLQDAIKTLQIQNLRLNNEVRDKNRIIHEKNGEIKVLKFRIQNYEDMETIQDMKTLITKINHYKDLNGELHNKNQALESKINSLHIAEKQREKQNRVLHGDYPGQRSSSPNSEYDDSRWNIPTLCPNNQYFVKMAAYGLAIQ